MFYSQVDTNLPQSHRLEPSKVCKGHSSSKPISTKCCISIPTEKKCNTGLK